MPFERQMEGVAAFFRRDPRWWRIAIAAVVVACGIFGASELIANAVVADLVIVLLSAALLLFVRRHVRSGM